MPIECQGCGVYVFPDFSDEGDDICDWCGLGTNCCCECGEEDEDEQPRKKPRKLKQCSRCGHIGTDVIDRLRGYVDKPFRWVVECGDLPLCWERQERKEPSQGDK